MSLSHLLILGIIALIVIPPEKLPEVAKQAARFINDLRRMTSGIWDDLKQEAIFKPEDLLKTNQQNRPNPSPLVNPPADPNHTIQQNTQSASINQLSKEPTLTQEQIELAQKKAHEEYLKSIQVPDQSETIKKSNS